MNRRVFLLGTTALVAAAALPAAASPPKVIIKSPLSGGEVDVYHAVLNGPFTVSVITDRPDLGIYVNDVQPSIRTVEPLGNGFYRVTTTTD